METAVTLPTGVARFCGEALRGKFRARPSIWAVRPPANARCRAMGTSAGLVADPPVCRKGHPRARFSSLWVHSGQRPWHFRAGVPAPAVGHSVEMLRHGLRISHFGPPCHGRPSSRTACPAVRTSGRGTSAMESVPALPRGLTAPLADVPGVCRLKAHSSGTSWRGRDPCGASPRGAYWLPARRPRPLPPPAFFYREPRWKRDPRALSPFPTCL